MESFAKIIETEYVLMPTWKWACLLLLILIFPFIRRTIEMFVKKIKESSFFTQNSNIFVVEFSKSELERPLSWIISLMVFILFIDVLEFPKNIDKYAILIAQILIGFRWLQLLILSIDVIAYRWSIGFNDSHEYPNQIVPFAVKSAKTVLVILGVLIALQNLGINVVSILAGLGIGGLAIALAGQETVANLFGSLTILVDKPFKLNDYVKVLDVEGTVIEIGFRSTKIRTPTNTIVTISNSTVAKEKLENLSARQKRRIRHNVTLACETPRPAIQAFMDEVTRYLLSHPKVYHEDVLANLISLSSYSIDIQITFFADSPDAKIENEVQQDFLFQVLTIAEKLKIEIAYPTQKIYVNNPQPAANYDPV